MNAICKRATYASVIGAVLAEERERRNVSQLVTANVAGLTQSTWGRMELGRACTLENLAKASHAFKFELWQLLKVVDDRVKGLEKQGIVVVYELPSDDEIKSNPDEWIVGSNAISRVSLLGLGSEYASAALQGVSAYISKLFK